MNLALSELLPVLFGAAFALAGVVMILLAIRRQVIVSALNRTGERVTGIVTDTSYGYVPHDDSRPPAKREHVEFSTADGRRIAGSPAYNDLNVPNRTGQEVTVIHDRRRPERFLAPKDSTAAGSGPTIVRIMIGLGFIVVGVIGGYLFLVIAVITG